MKKILLGAAIAAAAIFTACDSDDSSTGGSSSGVTSCDLQATIMGLYSTHQCAEASNAAMIRDTCDAASAMLSGGADDYGFEGVMEGTATLGSGCPSGYVIRCDDAAKGYTLYSYDAEDRGLTCEEFLADDEEDDYGFTPDDDEYYMKALKKAAKK